jgi:hypothetical protein
MNMLTIETQEFYVCAGICRIDSETSTCVGCGRPVVELKVQADTTIVEKMPRQRTGPDSGDKAAAKPGTPT